MNEPDYDERRMSNNDTTSLTSDGVEMTELSDFGHVTDKSAQSGVNVLPVVYNVVGPEEKKNTRLSTEAELKITMNNILTV